MLLDQETGDIQGLIANGLGRQAFAREPREIEVLRIVLELRRRGVGRALVRLRADDQPHHVLHIPTALAELDSQPIEQLGMVRVLTLQAEVFGGAHEADRKQLLPQAVHGHARHERVGVRDQPLGQTQAVRGRIRRQGAQSRGNAALALAALVRHVIATARQGVGVARHSSLAHHHRLGHTGFERCLLRFQARNRGLACAPNGGESAAPLISDLLVERRPARRCGQQSGDKRT